MAGSVVAQQTHVAVIFCTSQAIGLNRVGGGGGGGGAAEDPACSRTGGCTDELSISFTTWLLRVQASPVGL